MSPQLYITIGPSAIESINTKGKPTMLGSVTINIGKSLELAVDLDKLAEHPTTFRQVITRGLKPTLEDTHANETLEAHKGDNAARLAASMACAVKKLQALYSGETRIERTRASAADPVGTWALKLARVAVGKKTEGALRAKQLVDWATKFLMPNTTPDEGKAVLAEAIKRYAALPDIIAKAEVKVKEENELSAIEL